MGSVWGRFIFQSGDHLPKKWKMWWAPFCGACFLNGILLVDPVRGVSPECEKPMWKRWPKPSNNSERRKPFDAFLSSLCWGYWRVSQAKKSVIPKPVQSKAGKSGERQIFLPCPTIVADHLWSEGCLAKFKPLMSTMLLSSCEKHCWRNHCRV